MGIKITKSLKKRIKKSHFVILPSQSEGWPKAIAEGMFWSCIPLATSVSCIPDMLDYGKRGLLLQMDLNRDLAEIEKMINDKDQLLIKSKLVQDWSQQYTTDIFEAEIKNLAVK